MKRITLLIPFLGLTAFGSYYHQWDTGQRARNLVDAKDPLATYAHRSGHDDATRDLARGRRRLLTHGEPAAWQQEYSGLLNRIYRIEVESLASGPVGESLEHYTTDYNAVMRRELAGVFVRISSETPRPWRSSSTR